MARPKLLIKRRAYTRKDGTKVKAVTFRAKDTGEPGRTPKSERWYKPTTKTGWEAGMPMGKRRKLVLRAHGRDYLAAARGMQALANIQAKTNPDVARKARADAKYFFRVYDSTKK